MQTAQLNAITTTTITTAVVDVSVVTTEVYATHDAAFAAVDVSTTLNTERSSVKLLCRF